MIYDTLMVCAIYLEEHQALFTSSLILH